MSCRIISCNLLIFFIALDKTTIRSDCDRDKKKKLALSMYQFSIEVIVSIFDFWINSKIKENGFHFISEVGVVQTIVWLMEYAKV